jgi:hypothetical protein
MKPCRVVLLVACAALAGCGSPETARSRGGGPGADVGNRSRDVKMHEGSDPYWKTPERIEGAHASLEPARQARELSRRSTGSGQGR